MINKFKNSRGFTLVETMVAISVLMFALVGPLTIIQNGLQATTIAKDQDTAFYLGQDAVEYVRWARDTNRLNNLDWLAGGTVGGSTATVLTPCVSSGGTASCYLDSLDQHPTVPTVCSGTCPLINHDTANDYFTYNSTNGTTIVPTIFTRTITITTPVGGNAGEASVVVKVSWCDQANVCATTPRSITVREDIFNWQ